MAVARGGGKSAGADSEYGCHERKRPGGACWTRGMTTKSLSILMLMVNSAAAQEGWWMKEPIRWVQTNLRQTDAGLDAARLAGQLADMRANVVLMGMGGIAAYYPTAVEFHYPSPDLPAGRDMFGDVLREAHARKIRVVGRFDFSKTRQAVFDAHPEWFFRQSGGQPVIYNGLYSTCINGGFYRGQAMKILSEVLDRYAVRGLFFNMFGNPSRDYSGRPVGLCHCDSCQRKYRQLYHKDIPETPDDDYRKFMFTSSREVAAAIGDLIRKKRPQAGYFNYIQEYTDGIMSESNTAVARPLPLWPYSASDHVNRARNSEPGKMAIDLNMQFVDYWWRFATVPRQEIALRAWQSMANGGALTFEVNGTLDLQDRQALETVKPIFRWAAAHEQYYAGQSSAARAAAGSALRLGAHLWRRTLSGPFPAAQRGACAVRGGRQHGLGVRREAARVRPGNRRRLGSRRAQAICGKRGQAAAGERPCARVRGGPGGAHRERRKGLRPGSRPRGVSVAERHRSADAERTVYGSERRWGSRADAHPAIADRASRVGTRGHERHEHARHGDAATRQGKCNLDSVEPGRHVLPAQFAGTRGPVPRRHGPP